MSKDLFNFSDILGNEASEKDKQDLENDMNNFFSEDGEDVFIPIKRTSVSQNPTKKFQDVDAIVKNRNLEEAEDGDINDLALFFEDEKLEKKEDKKENNKETPEGEEDAEDVEEIEDEVEDSEVEEDADEDEDVNEEESEINPKILEGFAELLHENGLISDKKIKNLDDLKDKIKETFKNTAYENLNEVQKKYLEGLESGLSHEFMEEHIRIYNNLKDITDTDLKDDEFAKQVYSAYLKQKGFSQSEIDRTIERTVKAGELFEESKTAHEQLLAAEEQRLEENRKAAEKEREELKKSQEKIYKEVTDFFTSGKSEVIPGFKISPKIGKEILKEMYDFKYKDKTSGRSLNSLQKFAIENPAKYQAISYYLFKKGFFTGEADISDIKQKATSQAAKKFAKMLEDNPGLKGSGKNKHVSGDDELDMLINAL